MSSSDEEAASPDLGASSATEPVPAMPEDDDEIVGKKKQMVKEDEREWEHVATFKKGEEAIHDP